MKTFETEKHSIPDGATHYIEESRIMTFGWAKGLGTDGFSVYPVESGEGRWIGTSEPIHSGVLKPIPQTKEVEWDGEYQLEGGSGWFKYKTTYTSSSGDMFAMCLVPNANKGKPFEQYLDLATTKVRALETEAERVEREREDAINEMSLIVEAGNGFAGNAYKKYCASLYDAGYRKESE